jgi:hypothetical protein
MNANHNICEYYKIKQIQTKNLKENFAEKIKYEIKIKIVCKP